MIQNSNPRDRTLGAGSNPRDRTRCADRARGGHGTRRMPGRLAVVSPTGVGTYLIVLLSYCRTILHGRVRSLGAHASLARPCLSAAAYVSDYAWWRLLGSFPQSSRVRPPPPPPSPPPSTPSLPPRSSRGPTIERTETVGVAVCA
jgi:hypothetical protein